MAASRPARPAKHGAHVRTGAMYIYEALSEGVCSAGVRTCALDRSKIQVVTRVLSRWGSLAHAEECINNATTIMWCAQVQKGTARKPVGNSCPQCSSPAGGQGSRGLLSALSPLPPPPPLSPLQCGVQQGQRWGQVAGVVTCLATVLHQPCCTCSKPQEACAASQGGRGWSEACPKIPHMNL